MAGVRSSKQIKIGMNFCPLKLICILYVCVRRPTPFKGWFVRGHIAQGTENTRYASFKEKKFGDEWTPKVRAHRRLRRCILIDYLCAMEAIFAGINYHRF